MTHASAIDLSTSNRLGTRAAESFFIALYVLIIGLQAYRFGQDHDLWGPVRDTSVYSYVGRVVAMGGVPYLDAWDSKGPILHLAHTLPYLLPGEPWATYVALICVILFIGLFALHVQLSRLATPFASLLAIVPTLGALAQFSHFGLAELLTLPFLLCGLAAFLSYAHRQGDWPLPALGAIVGVTLLVRVDLAALPLMLALSALVLTKWRALFRAVLLIAGGAIVAMLPVLAWLYAEGALFAMVDQYLGYNSLHHIDRSLTTRALSVASLTLTFLLAGPLGLFASLGWCLTARQCWSVLSGHQSPSAVMLEDVSRRTAAIVLLTITIAFVVDFGLSFISGRGYDHYVVRLIPESLFLATVFLHTVLRGAGIGQGPGRLGLATFFVLAISLVSFGQVGRSLARESAPDDRDQLIAFLQERLNNQGSIFVYGTEGWPYNRTGTFAPTRYFYTYPLIAAGYTRRDYQLELLQDLESNPPTLIVDMPNPRLTPLDLDRPIKEKLEEGYLRDVSELWPLRNWVRTNYTILRRFDVEGGTAAVWTKN
jgi:hypothetical protein